MSQKPNQVFLEKSNYRMRRIIDAVRLLPFLGLFFLAIPLLWGNEQNTHLTSTTMIYFFLIWFLLIGVTAWLSRLLVKAGDKGEGDRSGTDLQ